MAHHHITVGDSHTPWCDWLGTAAGRDIETRAGGHINCGHTTKADARRAADALRGQFRTGVVVNVVAGRCPHDDGKR